MKGRGGEWRRLLVWSQLPDLKCIFRPENKIADIKL